MIDYVPKNQADQTFTLLSYLSRGGYGYYWTLPYKKSYWWDGNRPGKIPNAKAVYFGVNPCRVKKGEDRRATLEEIAGINCLYAEFDAAKQSADPGKAEQLAHIVTLPMQPSVLIDSGGGWHCYWLLSECFRDTPRAKSIQARWVTFVGGDESAKDLARVLRVPGTTNHKYSPPRPVITIYADFLRIYTFEQLEACLPPIPPPPASAPPGDEIDAGTYWLNRYLGRAQPGNRNANGFDLACQIRDSQVPHAESVMREYARRVPGEGYSVQEALSSLREALKSPPRPAATFGNKNNPPDAKPIPPAASSPEAAPKTSPRGAKPTDDELAVRWIDRHPQTVYGLGSWRRYDGGVWQELPTEAVGGEILHILEGAKQEGIKPSASDVSSVKELARLKLYKGDEVWDNQPDLILCKNGALHIPSMQLQAHSPQHYATSALPFDYLPQAQAPTWQYLLNDILPGPRDFIQEFAGYCLTTDTRHEIAVWLYGPRGSGKSTLEEGFIAMLGERATVLGLADIERSRFSLWNLRGKTLAVASEQPSLYMQSSHVLNAIISGEALTVERKYKDPVEIRSHVKVIWAMNDLPRVPDAGNGLFRRVKVIKFPALPDEKRDPKIKERIKQEGAGIFNWALLGLKRLLARGKFDIPPCVQNATSHFQETNDVAALFVAESCIMGATHKTRSNILYESYVKWCLENGHKSKSSTAIADDWERLGFERKRTNGSTFWHGVGVVSILP